MALMSKAAYARKIGCTPRYIRQLCDDGIIKPVDNKVDPEQADAAIAASRSYRQLANSTINVDAVPAMNEELADRDYNALYLKSRALHEEEKARLAKLKADELAGAVLSADQVRLDFFDLAKTVANAILAVPDRLANELAATTEPERVHQALSAELRRCLEDMQEHWERHQTGRGD